MASITMVTQMQKQYIARACNHTALVFAPALKICYFYHAQASTDGKQYNALLADSFKTNKQFTQVLMCLCVLVYVSTSKLEIEKIN